jgi:hypothetical protein
MMIGRRFVPHKVKVSKPSTSRTKTAWLPIDQSKMDGPGMTVSIKSSEHAPKLTHTVDFLPNEDSTNAKEMHVLRHSASVDFSFGHVYKVTSNRAQPDYEPPS